MPSAKGGRMGMGMVKKLMMVCSIWNEDYVRGLLAGMDRRIADADVELHVFASYDTAGDNSFQKKEQEIFSLPDVRDYDGVLFACNSVGSMQAVMPLAQACRRCGTAVISIEQKFEEVPIAGVNNYREFYRLVEHMLTVHGCKVLNYVGGPENNTENMDRLRAFCDCMTDHGLQPESERIVHYHFLHQDGERAYREWKEKGLHLPDAVICANDNMAIGYCNAAAADGYRIPEDLLVSGFDNFDEGQYFSPSLSSVNRNWEQLGYDTIDQLLQMINGEGKKTDIYSGGRLALNESCGCALGCRNMKEDLLCVYRAKKRKELADFAQRMDRLFLSQRRTMEELQDGLTWCLDTVGIKDLVLCLNSSLFEEDITDEKADYDNTLYVLTKREKLKLEKKETLEPARFFENQGAKIYLYSSLTFGRDTYGYSIAVYENALLQDDIYRSFKESATVALESIRQREELRRMNEKLQQLYVQDPMTGLYNRFGYMNQAQQYLQEHGNAIYLVYVDVDNLKTINDHYGHAMGDWAICTVAEAIREIFGKDSVCVRMGGDEFLVLDGSTAEEILLEKERQVELWLKEYSRRSDAPFVLHASMGHVSSVGSTETLELLVKQADDRMYIEKQKRKKHME